MKKILILLLTLLSGYITNGQVQKFQCEAYTIRYIPEDSSSFTDWKDWKVNKSIILYTQEGKITVSSPTKHDYFILKISDHILFKDGEVIIFEAIDDSNIKCIIEFVVYPSGIYHLYIRWLDLQIVYQMQKL